MSILSEIGAWLLGVPAATLAFLKNAIFALAANPQIQAIATQEVANAETAVIAGVTSGSAAVGAAKFAAAQTGVVAQLTAAGVPVVMNQVNLAIEAAVANLKATRVPNTAAPTAPAPVIPATGT